MNDISHGADEKANVADQNDPAKDQKNSASGAADTTAADGKATQTSMEAQLAEAQAKAAEYLDGWQRARADFVNYRKRSDQERSEAYGNATVDALRKILPVIDDFDRAISNIPAGKAEDDVIKGFILIHRKLTNLLESAGITVINPIGQRFDPKFHEAIGQDESIDVPSGHITTVLQKGYVHGDKVLRPAMVRIAA